MSGFKKATWFLVSFVIVGLMAASASASTSLLDTGVAYNDGSEPVWEGNTPFESEIPSGLKGSVDWAVFAPWVFPFSTGSDLPPIADQFTYVYQVHNTGAVEISNFSVDMDNLGGNIGWFSDAGNGVAGTAPSYVELAPLGYASWDFGYLATNASSAGLAFSSQYAPKNFTAGIVDGGTFAYVIPVPSPSSNSIPEPGTLVLLTVALGTVLAAKRFQRRAK